METEDGDKKVFVIHKSYIDNNNRIAFIVSTKEIQQLENNISKELIQLPYGKCNNVRFDIDGYSGSGCRLGCKKPCC
jgi:hypothetical protein